jgi:hypothetical protein
MLGLTRARAAIWHPLGSLQLKPSEHEPGQRGRRERHTALQLFPTWGRLNVVRILVVAGALVTVTVALSACSGAGEAATVTGVASPCGGPAGQGSRLPGWVLEPVRVTAMRSGRTVASETVSYRKDRDRYQLSLPPGTYSIADIGDPHGLVVTLHAGQRMTVNLPDLCR